MRCKSPNASIAPVTTSQETCFRMFLFTCAAFSVTVVSSYLRHVHLQPSTTTTAPAPAPVKPSALQLLLLLLLISCYKKDEMIVFNAVTITGTATFCLTAVSITHNAVSKWILADTEVGVPLYVVSSYIVKQLPFFYVRVYRTHCCMLAANVTSVNGLHVTFWPCFCFSL